MLATDDTIWKRVGTSGRYDSSGLSVQFANGDVEDFRLKDDPLTRTWTVQQSTLQIATLRYQVEADGTVSLDGQIGKDPVKLRLRSIDPQKFRLLVGR